MFALLASALVGFGVWFVQSRIEELRRARERLRDERRDVYSKILEPYIRLFSGLNDPGVEAEVVKLITSFDYRKTAFELNLIGSDSVVLAFNDMMMFFYAAQAAGEQPSAAEMLTRWGTFLLEIRRSIGDPNTKLGYRDMLRGLISDLDRNLGPEEDTKSLQRS